MQMLRDALPATQRCTFLNYAATAPMLRPAAERMATLARQGEEPLALHFDEWFRLLESTRRAVAHLIGASPEEIAFTTNTSTALSIAAAAVAWRAGDRVIHPADEFPSNRYVWQNLAAHGVRVEALPPGAPFHEQLAALDLARVRLVAFSHVSSRDGRRAELAAVARVAARADALVCVDGIQAVGAVPVDLSASGVDFYACGGQKWLLGPVGSGFLYVRSQRLDELHAPLVGWASSRTAPDGEAERLEFTAGARRLEPGLPDVAAIAGLGAAIETLTGAGWEQVFARVARHEARLREGLAGLGLAALSGAEPRAGIVTVEHEREEDARALAEACKRQRVLLQQRGRRVRVSAHATTSDEEIEQFLGLVGRRRGRTPPRASAHAPTPGGAASAPARSARRALVLGATRGLGRALAAGLARRGYALVVVGRDGAALERLAAELGADAHALDLADAPAVAAWSERHAELLGGIDLLVNAAAAAEARLFRDETPARIRSAFETNVLAPMGLTRAVLPGMLARRRGHVLNVVTSGARNAMPLFSTYAATKGALWAWSEALARELAATGVVVTTFLPPHMETATRRNLGRAALAHYDLRASAAAAEPPEPVAERALAALLAGASVVTPRGARFEIALNALAPAIVTHRVLRTFRG